MQTKQKYWMRMSECDSGTLYKDSLLNIAMRIDFRGKRYSAHSLARLKAC